MLRAVSQAVLAPAPFVAQHARVQLDAFFLPVPAAGRRFCIARWPERQAVRAWVLYVHPFAEEMNKSRRMAALLSQALATQGFGVLQLDLHGCGDSDGDFGNASWAQWLDDLLTLAAWAQARQPAPVWWWGLRAGCLVAAEAAALREAPAHFLFWQPVISGTAALTQFLRLRVAGEALTGRGSQNTGTLRALLQEGQALEIAGYQLPPCLANGLDQSKLSLPDQSESLVWLEIANRPQPDLLPSSKAMLASWQHARCRVHSAAVTGPAFWQTTEIEEVPGLVLASTEALCGMTPSQP